MAKNERARPAGQQAFLRGQVEGCQRQIDQMVYKLYGLTEEEIKIVEEGAGQTKRRTGA